MITLPAVQRHTNRTRFLLWGYLLAITVAELLYSIADVTVGMVAHAVILTLLIIHGALDRHIDMRRFALALTVAPLIRLLSLAFAEPLRQLPQYAWHPVVSIPLLIATWMVIRQLRVTRRELGLTWGNFPQQVMLFGGGLMLGAIEYTILEPQGLIGTFSWQTLGLASLSLIIFTGFTEEIIFRGLLQSLALRALGRSALLYVSLLFAALHIGYLSVADFLFVFAVGLVFAYTVYWSRSILGVTLAHGLTNVTLFLGLPLILQDRTLPYTELVQWGVWIGAFLWLVSLATIIWQAEREGRLLVNEAVDASAHYNRLLFLRRIAHVPLLRSIIRAPLMLQLRQRTALGFMLGALFGLTASAGVLVLSVSNRQSAANVEPVLAALTASATSTTNTVAAAPSPSPTTPSRSTPTAQVVAGGAAPINASPTPSPRPSATIAAPTNTRVPAPTNTRVPAPTTTPEPALVATVPPTLLPVAIESLPWPQNLPPGFSFVSADSWPLRTVAPDRPHEPFLVFRDRSRWILLRKQPQAGNPIPRSATTREQPVANTTGQLVTYLDGGLQLNWQQHGLALRLSGVGVTLNELLSIANSLKPLNGQEFATRLSAQARQVNLSLVWPTYLPAGMSLALDQSTVANETADGAVSEYTLLFANGEQHIEIKGGTAPPVLAGASERIQSGSVTGTLTVANNKLLLAIDDISSGDTPLLRFVSQESQASTRLPLVQQGPISIYAANIDRAEFDRVVAGLATLSAQEFDARSRGQSFGALQYLWPVGLPPGYDVDRSRIKFAWDDLLLQGGRPFYELIAAGPDGGELVVKGGRESSGAAFVLPEGDGVEQLFPTVRGQTATAQNTPDGAILLWTENDVYYMLTSKTLSVDYLTAIAERLQPLSVEQFYVNVQ